MKQILLSNYIYVIGTVMFTVASQLLIKWTMSNKYYEIPEGFLDKVYFISKALINPFILIAIFLVFLSGVCWMVAVTKFELSGVYPMVVAGLMLVTSIASIILFSESINIYKIIGILVILVGVYILYKGN